MKWRKILKTDIENALRFPDKVESAVKDRHNAYKTINSYLLKVTYNKRDEVIKVITAVWKGE